MFKLQVAGQFSELDLELCACRSLRCSSEHDTVIRNQPPASPKVSRLELQLDSKTTKTPCNVLIFCFTTQEMLCFRMWPTAPSCHCRAKAAQQPQLPWHAKLESVATARGKSCTIRTVERQETGSYFCFALYSVSSPLITPIPPLTFSCCFLPPLSLIMNPPMVPTKASGFSLWHLKLPTLIQAVLSLKQGSSAPPPRLVPNLYISFPPTAFSSPVPRVTQLSG